MGKRGRGAKFVVRLSGEERADLECMIRTGRAAAYRVLKARIVVKADVSEGGDGGPDARIAEALETSLSAVLRTRRQLVHEGREAALARKTRSPPPSRKCDGEAEAKLITLACSEPPEGYARWSLRLLEKRVVALGIVKAASDSTRGRVLKKSTQTAPKPLLGDPSQSQCGPRGGDGGRVGSLSTTP